MASSLISSVQSLSCIRLCNPMSCSTPGLSVHQQLPEFTQTQVHLSQWCRPAISISVVPFCPQSFPASESFPMSQLFAWGDQSTGVSAFSIIPSKEHPGPISFRMDWLDLLAVQGTLKSLLQHHSSKASILRLITSWQIDRETVTNYFLGSKINVDGDCSHEIKRRFLEEKLWQT